MSHTKGKLVPVHDMKAYGVVDTYISKHSYCQHLIVVSGQFHTLAVLPPKKDSPIPNEHSYP